MILKAILQTILTMNSTEQQRSDSTLKLHSTTSPKRSVRRREAVNRYGRMMRQCSVPLGGSHRSPWGIPSITKNKAFFFISSKTSGESLVEVWWFFKSFFYDTLYRPSPGINRAPIACMKMILIPIESLYKKLQFFALRVTPPAHQKPDLVKVYEEGIGKQKTRNLSRKWAPKTSKMEARTLPNRAQRAPRGSQDAQKTEKEDRPNKNHPGCS